MLHNHSIIQLSNQSTFPLLDRNSGRLSIRRRGGSLRLDTLWPPHLLQVDARQQHGEVDGLQPDGSLAGLDLGQHKLALFQALAKDTEPTI